MEPKARRSNDRRAAPAGLENGLPARPFPALGRTVSQLGYGSWPLGGAFGRVDDDAAAASLFAYLEAGGNFIDTARLYGRAEQVLGALLADWSGPAPVIATKVAPHGPARQWGAPVPVDVAFPPGSLTASVEESLSNLRLDSVDLIQLHVYWPQWGLEGYWLDELETLRERGQIRSIGVSVPDYRHDNALPLVLSGRIDSVQTIVNIFDPLALDNLVPIARDHGVAVIARGVLDEGGLTDGRKPASEYEQGDLRQTFFGAAAPGEYDRHVTRLSAFVPEIAPHLDSLAIGAVLGHPGITTVIVSMATEDMVLRNIASACLPPFAPSVLDELWTRHRWVRNFFDAEYWGPP